MADRDPTADSARTARLRAAFADEEHRGLQLAARVRLLVVLVITVWISIENPFPELLYFYPFLVLFGLLGYGPLLLRRAGRWRPWMRYLFPLLDVTLLSLVVILPNPLEREIATPQMRLRLGNEMYLFVFICAAVYTYSPAIVLWTGFCAAAVWSAVTVWILMLPDSHVIRDSNVWKGMSEQDVARVWLDPHYVNLGLWGREVVLFLVASAALAAFVRRARRLVERQADAERERANLSRYFSANLVEELAQSDQPLGPTRQQAVGVLFADVVGFTAIAETLPPAAVIELLRAFHGRMAGIVFTHGGTLDKYIGDALMATFGTPRPGPTDAANTLRCGRAMVESLGEWNAERARRGEPPIRIGIGLHYGPVVLGDMGGAQRLEFAVVGDTVNVAQRLERLTRTLPATVAASDALVAAARREDAAAADQLLTGFTAGPPQPLRGRAGTMSIWQLP